MTGKGILTLLAGRKALPGMLRQRALVDGVWNGRKGWLAIGAVVWGIHGINKARHREETVMLREVLKPGERLLVSQAITRPTRKQRRSAAKVAGGQS